MTISGPIGFGVGALLSAVLNLADRIPARHLFIRLIPPLVDQVVWDEAFLMLALGPIFGIWSIVQRRRLPEAARMASGNR